MLRRTTIALSIAALALPLLSGCMAQSQEDEYRDVVPSAEALSIEVPGGEADAAGAASAALIGQRADFYQYTRDVSRNVNGSLWFVGQLIETILEYPATTVGGDYATWGPWNETLSPVTYVFHVHRVSEGHYRYVLRAKPRAEDDDAFVDVVAGETELDSSGGQRGSIGLDMDAAHAIDPGEHRAQGRIAARYDTASNPRVVEAAFESFLDEDSDEAISALYRYKESVDGSGSFEFGYRADIDDPGTAEEDIVLMSRWNKDGAGRGDALVTGGDAGDFLVHASECWDTSFSRTYYGDNIDMASGEGDVASCAFDEPLWSEL